MSLGDTFGAGHEMGRQEAAKTIASLQTALAAANESLDGQTRANGVLHLNITQLREELAAATARAEAVEGCERVLYQQLTTAEQSRDLTERVLVDTTEKLLAAERERDTLVADFDKAVNEAFADQRKAEADRDEAVRLLRGCWGQQEDGDLRFVVRVSGLGANPKSPSEIARELTQTRTAAMQGRGVVIDETSRIALDRLPSATEETA